MACASPNAISIHGSRQFVFPAQFNHKDSLLQFQSRRRRFQSISCQSNPDSSTTALMASTGTVTISRAPRTPCLHGRFCNRSPSSLSLGNLSQQNNLIRGGSLTRNINKSKAKRSLRVYGLFGGKKENNDKADDSSSKENKPLEPVATNDEADQVQASASSDNAGLAEFPNKDVNRRIALISSIGAVGLFVTTRLDFGVSLKDLSASALPYEEALSNGKPTVVEFYADWCEVCRELAPDIYGVEQKYRDSVNFVMLNVDNTKWEQELDEFGVEGIPHFAFLDKDGNEEGNVVGRLPKQYFLDNVDALARGEASIPHARVVGQYSSAESRKVHQVVDPRSHG